MRALKTALDFASLSLVVFALGCATGPQFTTPRSPRADAALVYVFRPSAPPLALKPTILVNGVQVAELTNKGYFDLELKPGVYSIKADWSWSSGVPDGELALEVEAGQTYYVVVNSIMHTAGWGTFLTIRFEGSVGLMDEKAGTGLIAQCGRIKMHPKAEILSPPE